MFVNIVQLDGWYVVMLNPKKKKMFWAESAVPHNNHEGALVSI